MNDRTDHSTRLSDFLQVPGYSLPAGLLGPATVGLWYYSRVVETEHEEVKISRQALEEDLWAEALKGRLIERGI